MRPAPTRDSRWLAGLALAGSLAPIAVLILLSFLVVETGDFLVHDGLEALFEVQWRPAAGSFGALPLLAATLMLGLLATLVSLPLGTLVAIRLAFLAGPGERLIGEGAVAILAGMPSVVVGLVGLAWLPDALRFTLLGGVLTLTLMILPTYALLLTAGLRQLPPELATAGRALGLSEAQVILRLALPSVAGGLVGAANLAFGRALGEATAVSLVIGNVSRGPVPGLLEPANTLTTVILKDHGAAAGTHQQALFAVALILALVILVSGLLGESLRRRSMGGDTSRREV